MVSNEHEIGRSERSVSQHLSFPQAVQLRCNSMHAGHDGSCASGKENLGEFPESLRQGWNIAWV
jgi:hypothetical protein